jgi:hypothetical protein
MHKLKQGLAAIGVVAALGLVSPASFTGPASADVTKESKQNPQPMSIKCDLDGQSGNGFEYETRVTSNDKGNDLGTMHDTKSDRKFVAVAGDLYSTYTAIEDNTNFPQDDSSPFAMKPLDAGDSRLAGGYPVSFDIPPGYPASFEFDSKPGKNKKTVVDCIATDLGVLQGAEAKEELGASARCLRDGVQQGKCYQNFFQAGAEDAQNNTDCVAFGNEHYDTCMVEGLTYHYHDDYHIKARVKRDK